MNPLILLDSDVVIHFFHADRISLLNGLYAGRLRLLDVVLTELLSNRTVRDVVENLITFRQVEELKFPSSSSEEIFSEYVSLASTIDGRGERACLAYCRFTNNIIASSNTRDIVPYCQTHAIAYLTTLDIFCVAIHRNLMTAADVNQCLQQIIAKGSRLRSNDINHYLVHHFDRTKLNY